MRKMHLGVIPQIATVDIRRAPNRGLDACHTSAGPQQPRW
jgi:hypothetical protein